MAQFDTSSLLAANLWAEQLQSMGVDIPQEPHSDAVLKAVDPGPGEQVVGYATDEEMLLFSALFDADEAGDKMFVDLLRDQTISLADKLANAKDFADVLSSALGSGPTTFPEPLWRARHKYKLIHSMLWWSVGERLRLHHYHLGIRTQRRIVTTGLRR